MKLLERYALFTGLKIGKQHFLEKFAPLPFDRYITLQASSGMAAKNYPFYVEVITAIKPYLDAAQIKIVQIGGKGDTVLPGCHSAIGEGSLHQGNYLVGRSLLHFGNDSIWAHRAGYLGKPLVTLFGPTSANNHSATQFNALKTCFISSHRWGNQPSFQPQETPSTMTLIDPFDVARAVLDLLEISHTITQSTTLVGQFFAQSTLEAIPNAVVPPSLYPGAFITVRMDYEHNEEVLRYIIQSGRKINLLTNKAIVDTALLMSFRDSYASYNHELFEDTDPQYVKSIRALFPKAVFFTRSTDEAYISRLRFRFFDVCTIEKVFDKTIDDYFKDSAHYLNKEPLDKKTLDIPLHLSKLEFKTNKFLLSNDKIYLSRAHQLLDQPALPGSNVGQVMDHPEFWSETNHFHIYTK